MAIESRPFGGVTLSGEDARKFREQIGETISPPKDGPLKRYMITVKNGLLVRDEAVEALERQGIAFIRAITTS